MTQDSGDPRWQSLYDWWSHHPRALAVLYQVVTVGREDAFRRRSVEALDLAAGECVLAVGCGNGNGFAALRDRVGPTGRVVGLDASRGMVRAARGRVRDRGWENVDVLRGDACDPPMAPATVDAASAAMSLSAVPDPKRAVAAVASVLRPGGRLVVLDARPFQQWPWRALNGLVVPLARAATNWVPEVDLVAALRDAFETVDVATFNGGSMFVARADSPAIP